MALSLAVLKIKDFRLLMLTRVVGTMAMQAQAVVAGWQIYSLTKDPFMLGLAGLAEALPAIICALFAGHIVDNSRPWRVFVICVGVLVTNMLMLLLIAGGIVPAPGGSIVAWIFAGVFTSGIARSFLQPASFTLLSQIVTQEKMSGALAWLTSSFQMAAVTGPAIAGLVYGGYGVKAAWLLPVSLMSLEFLVLLGMTAEKRAYRSQHKREPALKSIVAGWSYIWRSRTLLSVMALDMFAVLFGGATAILPVFADQILHTGPHGLGALRAAPAMGSVTMALCLALWPMKNIKGTTLLAAITGFGVCIIGFGLSNVFWAAMLLLALSGMFDSVSMVIRGTLMQLLTPDKMRGRVSAVNSMFIISSNEIGAFESGTAARLLGLVPSIVFGGIGTLVVVASTFTFAKKLRKIEVNTEGKIT